MSKAEIEAKIRECEARLYAAMATSNLEELNTLIADDLLFVGPDGQLATKALDLELHRTGATVFTQFDPKGLQLRILDGSVVALARIFLSGTYLGQPFAGKFQYMRVWVLCQGSWQVTAGSVVAVQNEINP